MAHGESTEGIYTFVGRFIAFCLWRVSLLRPGRRREEGMKRERKRERDKEGARKGARERERWSLLPLAGLFPKSSLRETSARRFSPRVFIVFESFYYLFFLLFVMGIIHF